MQPRKSIFQNWQLRMAVHFSSEKFYLKVLLGLVILKAILKELEKILRNGIQTTD